MFMTVVWVIVGLFIAGLIDKIMAPHPKGTAIYICLISLVWPIVYIATKQVWVVFVFSIYCGITKLNCIFETLDLSDSGYAREVSVAEYVIMESMPESLTFIAGIISIIVISVLYILLALPGFFMIESNVGFGYVMIFLPFVFSIWRAIRTCQIF